MQLDKTTFTILLIVIFGIGVMIGILLAMIAVKYGTEPGEASPGFPDQKRSTKNCPNDKTYPFGNPNKYKS